MDQVKFVEDCLCRPYSFKLFEGCLPQILLNRFLNTLSHIWKEENLHDVSAKFDVYMSTLVYFAHTAVNVVHINYMETFLLPFSFRNNIRRIILGSNAIFEAINQFTRNGYLFYSLTLV